MTTTTLTYKESRIIQGFHLANFDFQYICLFVLYEACKREISYQWV